MNNGQLQQYLIKFIAFYLLIDESEADELTVQDFLVQEPAPFNK